MKSVLPFRGDDTLMYSITYDLATPESRALGSYEESGYIVEPSEGELQDILLEANRDYGIYKPVGIGVFTNTRADHDNDYFTKGHEKYYTLFINKTDGSKLNQEELDFITALLNEGKYSYDEKSNRFYEWGGTPEYGIGGWIGGTLIGGFLGYQIGKAVGYGRAYRGYEEGGSIPEGYHQMPDGTIMPDSAHFEGGGRIEDITTEFFKRRFNRNPDSDPYYYETWKNRIKKAIYFDDFSDNMDSESISILKEVIADMPNSSRFEGGGEVRYFDRHANMDSETRREILEYTNYPILTEYYGEDGNDSTEYKQVKGRLDEVGFNSWRFSNYLYGMFDGYDYTKTKDFQDELAKIKQADPKFYKKITRIINEVQSYPTTEQPNRGNFGLGGLLLAGGFGAYVGYKIGRARPQKKGFETEKKVAQKIKSKAQQLTKKNKPAQAYAGGGEVKIVSGKLIYRGADNRLTVIGTIRNVKGEKRVYKSPFAKAFIKENTDELVENWAKENGYSVWKEDFGDSYNSKLDYNETQDKLHDLVSRMTSDEYIYFAYEYGIDEEDANEMANFISQLSDKEAEDIIKEIEDGYYAGGGIYSHSKEDGATFIVTDYQGNSSATYKFDSLKEAENQFDRLIDYVKEDLQGNNYVSSNDIVLEGFVEGHGKGWETIRYFDVDEYIESFDEDEYAGGGEIIEVEGFGKYQKIDGEIEIGDMAISENGMLNEYVDEDDDLYFINETHTKVIPIEEYAGGGKVVAYKYYDKDEYDESVTIIEPDELQEFLDDWNSTMETNYKNAKEFNAGEDYYMLEEIYYGGGETITKPRPTITPTETPTKPDKDNPYAPKVKPRPKADYLVSNK